MQNYINKLFSMIKKFFYDNQNFGFKIAYLNFFSEFKLVPFLKPYLKSINIKKDEEIYKFLETNFSNLIKKYQVKKLDNKLNSKIIWIFWYQGLENAPKLVQRCYEQILQIPTDYKVILLTKENINEYIKIPDFILKKLEKKKITITHFSDILRVALLKEYGGIWADATLYFNKSIFNQFDNIPFNTTIGPNMKWTGFFMGGGTNNFFNFLYEFLLEYHKNFDYIIDYFLIDYIIQIAYRNLNYAKKCIDNANIYNPNIYNLQSNFSKKYYHDNYLKILESAPYFKLSYKYKIKSRTKQKDLTNYGFFIEN